MQFRHHHVAAVHVKREISVLWQLGKAVIQRLKARQGRLSGARYEVGDDGDNRSTDIALSRIAPQHDGHVLVRDDATVALKAQRLAAVAQYAAVVHHAVRIDGARTEGIHAGRSVLLHQIESCGIGEKLAGEQGLEEDGELIGGGDHGAGRPSLAGVPFACGKVKG